VRRAVSIIIPAHNQLECCRQCVDSILSNTEGPYKLILVDNGSTDGVSEYFDSVPNATVVHSEANLGFPAGVNLGLAHAEGHVLLLNSDTIVPRDWLTRLLIVLEQSSRIGIVGPVSNNVSGPQQIPTPNIESTDTIEQIAQDCWDLHAAKSLEIDRVVGFCMLIHEKAFQDVGRLDETFGIGNFEDDDYCLRVRKAGYRICMAPGCFVFHYGSRTFQSLGYTDESYRELIQRNESEFNRKWGLQAGEPRLAQLSMTKLREAQDLRALGNLTKAIAAIAEAIKLEPNLARAYNDLGALLWEAGEYERAVEQFRRAVRLNPGDATAARNLAESEQALRNMS